MALPSSGIVFALVGDAFSLERYTSVRDHTASGGSRILSPSAATTINDMSSSGKRSVRNNELLRDRLGGVRKRDAQIPNVDADEDPDVDDGGSCRR